ncbi:phage replisome organizer N-terminal domain-containing protein [Weissella hellenica]|nr:phage replisome organizer N-terminal domain-containing protein [Weissella hellenica]
MINKRYFWLKLPEEFFNRKEIKALRRIAGGDTYTVIYLKMLLKSLQSDGKLYFEGVANNFIEEIALDIDEDIENVQVTVNYLHNKGLLVDSGSDEVELVSMKSMVGSESSSTERKRRQRERERQTLIERDIVTPKSRQGHVEIEKELDIDKEIETEGEIEKKQSHPTATVRQQLSDAIEKNGFSLVLTPFQSENLLAYVEDDHMEVGVVIRSLEEASNNGKRNYNYVRAILENKLKEGITTVAKWDASKRDFQERRNANQVPKNDESAEWAREMEEYWKGN